MHRLSPFILSAIVCLLFACGLALADESAERHPATDRAARLIEQGDVDGAIRVLVDAVRAEPEDARLRRSLAAAYMGAGKYADAASQYEKATEIEPDDKLAFHNLGNAYFLDHQYNQAVWAYKNALRIDPDFADALTGLGNAYQAKGDVKAAVSIYKHAVRVDPKNHQAWFALGGLAFATGNAAKAVEYWLKAEALIPDSANVLYNLAVGYLILEQPAEADKRYERLKEIDPKQAAELAEIRAKAVEAGAAKPTGETQP